MSLQHDAGIRHSDVISLSDLVAIVWRRKILFIVFLIIGVILTLLIALSRPASYQFGQLLSPINYMSYTNTNTQIQSSFHYVSLDGENLLAFLQFRLAKDQSFMAYDIQANCLVKNASDCTMIGLNARGEQNALPELKVLFQHLMTSVNNFQQGTFAQAQRALQFQISNAQGQVDAIQSSLLYLQKLSKQSLGVNATPNQSTQPINYDLVGAISLPAKISDLQVALAQAEQTLVQDKASLASLKRPSLAGSMTMDKRKPKTALIIVAGVILSIIVAFLLCLFFDALFKVSEKT